MEYKKNEPLSRHTYYRIGGPADEWMVPEGIEDLRTIAAELKKNPRPYFVMGAGSNLLVSDQGFRGLVIKISRLNSECRWNDDRRVVVTGASLMVSTFLRQASQHGWKDLGFLSGVPGTMGGVVMMNAGTHLGEAKDHLSAVEAFSLETAQLDRYEKNELSFEYRKNLFLGPDKIVWSAEWAVQVGDPAVVKFEMDEMLSRRKKSQPVELPSCGSVFKNPKSHGLHAWQVIEKIGLRGYRMGDAEFSVKHCNFIVNLGKATAADVYSLIQLAKAKARAELQIELEEEVKCVGF